MRRDIFCPNCGVKDVWQDDADMGDYYCGTSMHCMACKCVLSDIGVGPPPSEPFWIEQRREFEAEVNRIKASEAKL